MRYEFQPEALAEFEEAARYLATRQSGLEIRFIQSVENAIARVLESPRAFRVFDGEVRRCLTHVFPYAVLYVIEPDYILILAVMHCHREPGYWRHRLQDRA